MIVYVYALRLRGELEPRYIGQTKHIALRLAGHFSIARQMPLPTPLAQWLIANGKQVEAVELSRHLTRAESLAAEAVAIRTFAALGFPIFNRHHVAPLRLAA